jgi:hypothetical protein
MEGDAVFMEHGGRGARRHVGDRCVAPTRGEPRRDHRDDRLEWRVRAGIVEGAPVPIRWRDFAERPPAPMPAPAGRRLKWWPG